MSIKTFLFPLSYEALIRKSRYKSMTSLEYKIKWQIKPYLRYGNTIFLQPQTIIKDTTNLCIQDILVQKIHQFPSKEL